MTVQGKIQRTLVILAVVITMGGLIPPGNARGQTENTWDEIAEAPADIGGGASLIYHDGALYISAGGGENAFWRLDLAAESWQTLASFPEDVDHGGDMAFDGTRYIYATKGTEFGGLVGTRKFWRYDIRENSWEALPDTPETVGSHGSLVFADGTVFMRPGKNLNSGFYRYDPTSSAWQSRSEGPTTAIAAGPRAAMSYDGVRFIYTFQGGENIPPADFLYDDIWRYDTRNDQWLELGHREELDRADLVWVANGFYALNEYAMVNFQYFDVSQGEWFSRPDLPCGIGIWDAVGPGASLEYDGGRFIYALEGGNQRQVWRYHLEPNSATAIAAGLEYLRSRHSNYTNGSWSNDIGVTGLATLAFLNQGYDESDPDVQKAIQYISANVRSDGSIYSNYYRRNYHTSMALLPLKATQNSSYADEVEAAKNWLVRSQWDDSCLWGSVSESNWYWGGFGYGTHSRPDLSNSQFALLALNAADVPQSDPAWGKALTFVSRCQNRQASNDGFSPHDDGGFIYHPGGCLAPGCASYGSITGAGIWGLALAGRTPNDPRFKAALDWVEDNYTWDYNPLTDGSWGSNSLYYYYLSMSKALSMARRSRIGDHDWYQELSDKLSSLQRDDGSWVNSNSWLWENNPELVTSYALLALQTRQLPIGADLELVIILHSPADLHLYDAKGRHVGKNYDSGGVDLEVPGSSYSPDDPQTISVHPPVAGNYHLELVGTGEGDWQIEIIGPQDGVQVSYDSYAGSITPGAVLATDLNVGAFEGALTIFSSQPAAAPVLDVDPDSLSLTGQPGAVGYATFTVSETGGNADIQGVSIFATDLTDGSGNSIPGANVTFDPNNFDLDPGASQSVDVSVSVPGDVPDGDYSGSITVESLNAGTKSVQLTVEVRSNTPPTADAGGPYEGDEGVPIPLDASASSDPDDNIVLYEWDLDNDGEYDDATGVTTDAVFGDDGSFTVGLRVTDEYGESDTDTAEVLVQNVRPDASADPVAQEAQYSDYIADVAVTATDVALDLLTVSRSWSLDGGGFIPGLPGNLELTDDGCSADGAFQTCTWTLTGIMNEAAGEYIVRALVDDEDGGQTEVDIGITVSPESATVAFAGDNSVSVRVEEDGGDSGLFSLAVTVSEKEPDEPIDRAAPGDISLADVKMSLVPVGPGGLVEGACTPGDASGLGYDAELPVTCDFDNVPVNTYSISATVSGGFFAGANEDVLTVYDPSLGFATGGGWFFWPGTTDKTNFGFTMKYKKDGSKVKGSLLLIRHVGDDAIYRVKSNALYGLALGTHDDPDGSFGWASFSGKCTYLEPGWPEPIGNYEFVVYVEDQDEPGTGVDRAWVQVLDKDNVVVPVMSMDFPATENAVELGGGNIAVPH